MLAMMTHSCPPHPPPYLWQLCYLGEKCPCGPRLAPDGGITELVPVAPSMVPRPWTRESKVSCHGKMSGLWLLLRKPSQDNLVLLPTRIHTPSLPALSTSILQTLDRIDARYHPTYLVSGHLLNVGPHHSCLAHPARRR